MEMQMQMIMTHLGGSGGTPWQGMTQQMRMSPRMRREPLTVSELERLLTFSGISAAPLTERNGHGYDDAASAAD